MDSNHRRRKPADLQSAPVGHLGNLPAGLVDRSRSIVDRTSTAEQLNHGGRFVNLAVCRQPNLFAACEGFRAVSMRKLSECAVRPSDFGFSLHGGR